LIQWLKNKGSRQIKFKVGNFEILTHGSHNNQELSEIFEQTIAAATAAPGLANIKAAPAAAPKAAKRKAAPAAAPKAAKSRAAPAAAQKAKSRAAPAAAPARRSAKPMF
jgi:hypothetical protein